MEKIFDQFFDNVSKRLDYQKDFTKFGEDSVRYDFFHAIQTVCQMDPHFFYLEHPFPETEFVRKKKIKKTGRGRKDEKPEFDLRIDARELLKKGIVAEFGFFRKPEIGKVDVTGNMGKLLNESSRLSLLKNYKDYLNHKALLIIVTDLAMINYGGNTRGRKPGVLITDEMLFDDILISKFNNTIKNKLKIGFKKKMDEYNFSPKAKRIFNKEYVDEKTKKTKWAIWIWEIIPELNKD
jgi:hypothetical protein